MHSYLLRVKKFVITLLRMIYICRWAVMFTYVQYCLFVTYFLFNVVLYQPPLQKNICYSINITVYLMGIPCY